MAAAAPGPGGARLGLLVSGHGRGTNLQAILDACASGEIPGSVAVVIGVRDDAPALDRARVAGVTVRCVPPPARGQDDAAYGQALLAELREHGVTILCLAGYMRILPRAVVEAYAGRALNVHPGLLPMFGGKGMYGERVHRAVIESGMKVSGCTVHLVDDEYDHGAILLQSVVPVHDDDTPETLAARVLPEEHRTYVAAIRLLALGRVRIEGRRARVVVTGDEGGTR